MEKLLQDRDAAEVSGILDGAREREDGACSFIEHVRLAPRASEGFLR